ncbi:protein NRT1/ PTR FAMILY 2.6-like [Prunus yedoensis var. nudiflora]|uniref:Protein NRT1/ PTR FAMILY 2.6-like n=1 Tax=Prunus yedoensis var. nudiflora TaxID=2094558 RepID=A0A314YQS2_PRUYE|nr:protein NRT1/ PTR FAMILY 2.6-like [Prunus yedoensis var. nudiflora]
MGNEGLIHLSMAVRESTSPNEPFDEKRPQQPHKNFASMTNYYFLRYPSSSPIQLNHLASSHHGPSAGFVLVIVFISTAISLTVIDRFLWPTWQKLTGQFPTSLQRIGLGHVLNVLGMVVSALVE